MRSTSPLLSGGLIARRLVMYKTRVWPPRNDDDAVARNWGGGGQGAFLHGIPTKSMRLPVELRWFVRSARGARWVGLALRHQSTAAAALREGARSASPGGMGSESGRWGRRHRPRGREAPQENIIIAHSGATLSHIHHWTQTRALGCGLHGLGHTMGQGVGLGPAWLCYALLGPAWALRAALGNRRYESRRTQQQAEAWPRPGPAVGTTFRPPETEDVHTSAPACASRVDFAAGLKSPRLWCKSTEK